MTAWITLKEAAARADISASLEELNAILAPRPSGKASPANSSQSTPEEQFQKLGLLFDRERYEAGETAFLQVLSQSSNSPVSPQTEEETQTSEPYELNRCTVRIVLTLLPEAEDGQRRVIVAASTHEDLPIARLTWLTDLEPLPQAIQDILSQLEADLPNRRYRAEVKQSKEKKKPRRKQAKTDSQPVEPVETQPTQVNLFGL